LFLLLLRICASCSRRCQIDMMDTMGTEIAFKDTGDSIFDAVDAKVKAAFTRAYNKAAHRSQALIALEPVLKGARKQAKTRKVIVTEDGEEEDDTDVDDSGDGEDGSGSSDDDEAPAPKPKPKGGYTSALPTISSLCRLEACVVPACNVNCACLFSIPFSFLAAARGKTPPKAASAPKKSPPAKQRAPASAPKKAAASVARKATPRTRVDSEEDVDDDDDGAIEISSSDDDDD
jgi:hypothetical protein